MRGHSTLVVSATASVGVTTTHIALAGDPASMRFVSPAVSQATAAAEVRTTPGTSSSSSSDAHAGELRGHLDGGGAFGGCEQRGHALPNALRSDRSCQLQTVRHNRTVSASLAGTVTQPG